MASLRTAFRAITPRTHLSRPVTTKVTSRIPSTARAQRTFATQRPADDTKPPEAVEQASEDLSLNDAEDPNMNGNYPDPSLTSALPLKRQFRDPYAEWWDPIERRNYNEPVHEDNDILGIFSPEKYTHFTAGWGGVLVVCF
jgi:NADH dehydrogenase (ubiquinone) 1 beta subcomplex subunit 8